MTAREWRNGDGRSRWQPVAGDHELWDFGWWRMDLKSDFGPSEPMLFRSRRRAELIARRWQAAQERRRRREFRPAGGS